MSQPELDSVRVKIYDKEYVFLTTGDPERFLNICLNLDKRMREVADASGSVDTLKVAILAALSLADDLARVREELKKMDESLSRRSLECVSMLDRFLA